MTTRSGARAVRAAIFAAVCVTTTALGHAMMSTDLPGWVLLAAFLGVGPPAYSLAGRERGALFVTASTVVTQLGLHSLFELSQSGTAAAPISPEQRWAARLMCDASGVSPGLLTQNAAVDLLHQAGLAPSITRISPPASGGGMSAMGDMPGMAAGRAQDLMSGAMGHMAHGGYSGWGMFLAHLVAAVVSGLWLWRGEKAAFQLARSLTGLLFAPLLLVLTAQGFAGLRLPGRPQPAVFVPRLRGALLHYVLSRRGPPLSAVCC